MKARCVNEFERARDSKRSMTVGSKLIHQDFDDHLQDLKDNKKPEQIEREKEMQTYAFLYSYQYVPVMVDGEEFHKKQIEIENLYQIDRLEKSDLMALSMMKIRAQHQEGAKLALVDIPTWMHNQKTASDGEISPELRKWIEKYKRKAFG